MLVLNDFGDIQDGLNILAEAFGGGMVLIFKQGDRTISQNVISTLHKPQRYVKQTHQNVKELSNNLYLVETEFSTSTLVLIPPVNAT